MTEPYPRRSLDLVEYEHQSRAAPCFLCRIIDGSHEFAHAEICRDDVGIGFLNRYPTMLGYAVVAPLEHRCAVVDDFTVDEYLALQRLVHRVGHALTQAVPTERLYVLSLGAEEGNAHVHWHLAPLPPGVPYGDQQLHALLVERTGYLDLPSADQLALAAEIAAHLDP